MYGVIYKITNKLNGKPYIGQTTQKLKVRFRAHRRENTYIGRAMLKYGIENFMIEVVEECDTPEQLNEREIFWIAFFNCKRPNGYNLTDGGEGSKGCSFTPEVCLNMSVSKKKVHPLMRRSTPNSFHEK